LEREADRAVADDAQLERAIEGAVDVEVGVGRERHPAERELGPAQADTRGAVRVDRAGLLPERVEPVDGRGRRVITGRRDGGRAGGPGSADVGRDGRGYGCGAARERGEEGSGKAGGEDAHGRTT
jgi:hypothetical protein